MSVQLLPSEQARFDEVCRFGLDRLEPLARTVAAAFADDPIWLWLVGRDSTLSIDEGLPLARALVADTSPIDETHGFRHHGAVALWRAPVELESDTHREFKAAQSGQHFATFGTQIGDRAELVGEFSSALKSARPAEKHWYLSILAASPSRQNQGLGTRVLAPMIERCDRDGVATYLESSNPRNHAFYQRLGYVETGETSGGGSPPVMGFLRQPK